MKYPQSELKVIADNCCLFMCYVWCMGIEPENLSDWLPYIQHGLENKVIDSDCTVLNGEKLLYGLTGRNWGISKVKIDSISGIKEPTPVKFYAKGYTPHWVVVQNGKIVFDPYLNSKSVKYGVPVDSRVLIRK